MLDPRTLTSSQHARDAIAAATDEALIPAIAALSMLCGRPCTRADLLAFVEARIADEEGN